MKAPAKKSHKKAHKVIRRRSHKKRRTGHKKVGKKMEISPISKDGSPHSLDNSPAFNMSLEHENSPEESVHSYSNMASQLDGGPSPAMDASTTDTTVESMEVNSPEGNDTTMDTDELVGPSPTNSSANTTRDRSTGGSKKRKRASRRKR